MGEGGGEEEEETEPDPLVEVASKAAKKKS